MRSASLGGDLAVPGAKIQGLPVEVFRDQVRNEFGWCNVSALRTLGEDVC